MTSIRLAGLEPVAEGRTRKVYIHPHDSGALIKITHPHFIEMYRRKPAPRNRQSFQFRHLTHTFREIREQLSIMAKGDHFPFQIQKVLGFIDTDLGIGEVVEMKKGADGRLAPTLRQLLREGRFDAEAEAALERFLAWLLDSDLTISELHPGNLVYAATEGSGQDFVLIDGIGEASHFPLHATFKFLNRAGKKRHIRILRTKMKQDRRAAGGAEAPSAGRIAPALQALPKG